MPFPYQTSGTPARTRKPLRDREREKDRDKERDKDVRSVASSSTKKHREASRSSNRSPKPSSPRPSSLYTQANVTSDQLPALPKSETTSPTLSKSPTLRASTAPSTSSTPLSSSTHLYTPAALQPYLETEDEDFDTPTPQASSSLHIKPYFEPDPVRSSSRPASVHVTSSPPHAPAATTTAKSPSPQQPLALSPALSRVSTRSSDPTPSLQHPRPHHVSPSSPSFTSTLPFFGGPQTDQYYSPFPSAPQYFPMAQAPNHPLDLHSLPPQNFYQPYAAHPQAHTTYSPLPLRSPPAMEQNVHSRSMSMAGEPPPPMAPPPPMMPPERQLSSTTSISNAQLGGDEEVLQRIRKAIPDLEHLMNQYKVTSSKLGEHESMIERTNQEKARAVEQRESEHELLTKQAKDAEHRSKGEQKRHADEKNKLLLEIGNWEDKYTGLEERLKLEVTRREEIEKDLNALQAEKAGLVEGYEQATKNLTERKIEFKRDLEEMEKALQQKEKAHVELQQRQAGDAEAALQARTSELAQKHAQEKATLETTLTWHKRELIDVKAKFQKELDQVKDELKRTVEDHEKKFSEAKEKWTQEKERMNTERANERAKIDQGSEQLTAQHAKEREGLIKDAKLAEERLNKDHADKMENLEAEHNSLKSEWETDKANFRKNTAELKDSARRLGRENAKLQRLAEAFEQVTDLKGRGDAYYLEAFARLSNLIRSLATSFCTAAPSPHTRNELAKTLPSNLAPFLTDDTPATTPLRVAYIQSLISSILTRHIFKPFLFTFSELDSIFNEWSTYLLSKSTKKEAVWRQRLLHAAFSSPSAKGRINRFAMTVIEEIEGALGPWIEKSKGEEMRREVRLVVKVAAETWRSARIELGRVGIREMEKPQEGEVLFELFPRVGREGLAREFRGEAREDPGCVYSAGKIITTNSPEVLMRRKELGENVVLPDSDVQHEHETSSPDGSSKRSSSQLGSGREGRPSRTASPLIPPTRHVLAQRHKTPFRSDEVVNEPPRQQREHDTEWPLHPRDETITPAPLTAQEHYEHFPTAQAQRTSGTQDDNNDSTRDQYHMHEDDYTGDRYHAHREEPEKSPLQSPAHSPPHSQSYSHSSHPRSPGQSSTHSSGRSQDQYQDNPQSQSSNRRSTASRSSSSDEENFQSSQMRDIVPNWANAGAGNIPGAFRGRWDGW